MKRNRNYTSHLLEDIALLLTDLNLLLLVAMAAVVPVGTVSLALAHLIFGVSQTVVIVAVVIMAAPVVLSVLVMAAEAILYHTAMKMRS